MKIHTYFLRLLTIAGAATFVFARPASLRAQSNGTTFNSGQSTITVAPGDTLNLGAITRNTGATVFFGTTGTITTSTSNRDGNTNPGNTNGFLGAYAVYGPYDFAANNGGTITYFTGYTTYDNVAGWSGNVDNKDVTDDGSGYDGTYTNSITINSLRFNEGNADSTVNINGGNNLAISSGGILVTPNLGVKYARINGGGLTTGSSADLVIQQQNTGSGHLQISSSIFGAGGLTKAGPGQFDLQADSPYQGVTTVNGGTMLLTNQVTGTAGMVVNNSGTLLLGANNRISNTNSTNGTQNVPVTLNGGTLNTGGFSEGASTGTSPATQGLGALTLSSSSTLDFGAGHTGSSVLAFADSSAQAWNGTLALLDFTAGTDYLNFANSAGLTSTQLSEITYTSGGTTYGGFGLDSFGNVTFEAVPEPATWAAGALLVGVVWWQFRRRLRRAAILSS